MTTKEALRLISDNAEVPALNYAVNYARAGLRMSEGTDELRIQCLYVLNNITGWRKSKQRPTPTKEQISECRAALKKEAGVK